VGWKFVCEGAVGKIGKLNGTSCITVKKFGGLTASGKRPGEQCGASPTRNSQQLIRNRGGTSGFNLVYL